MPYPFEETLPVEGLLVPARLPGGDMIVWSPDGKLGSNLVQVEVGAECQVPEAQKGSGRLDLIVVGARQLFDIAECLTTVALFRDNIAGLNWEYTYHSFPQHAGQEEGATCVAAISSSNVCGTVANFNRGLGCMGADLGAQTFSPVRIHSILC